MNKKAIINTFHTHSYYCLSEFSSSVISFDSHPDIRFITREFLEVMEEEMVSGLVDEFLRATVHFLLSRGRPTWLVIPESAFEAESSYLSRLNSFGLTIEGKEFLDSLERIKEMAGMDLDLFLSPPKDSEDLSERDWENAAIDVDVDCMKEFQDNCFTPATEEVETRNMDEVLRFITDVDPKLITISEAKSYKHSSAKTFLRRLEDLGYSVERGTILDQSNAEEFRNIHIDFEKSSQRNINMKPSKFRKWVKSIPSKLRNEG